MIKPALNILLVEDEAYAAMTLRMILERIYTKCHVVATGEEAIAYAEHDPPDIILMDIGLAGEMTGIEAAQRILASATIPIIFLTGYTHKEFKEQMKAVNPLGYFTKPLQIPELLSKINSAL